MVLRENNMSFNEDTYIFERRNKMDTIDIIENEEVIEVVEDIVAETGKRFNTAVGIGVVMLGGVLLYEAGKFTYKRVVKPLAAKVRTEMRRKRDEEDDDDILEKDDVS